MASGPVVAMVAGETSGDILAEILLGGMLSRWPTLEAFGIGGDQMQHSGFKALWNSDKLAVRGYVEVIKHYREIIGIRNRLKTHIMAHPPDLFIGIDAPDFNLDLEFSLKKAGIKTVHFVCPSIWAWRAERIENIRKSIDHILCIFPFEVDLLNRHGIAATYVGHPLASVIPMEPDRLSARKLLGLDEEDRVLAILPGSRDSEVKYLSERFFQTAGLIHKLDPEMKFVVPALPHLREKIYRAVSEAGMGGQIQVINGQSHTVLAACDVTLIASGTATLEAALFKRPMVIAYNMNWLSWQIMRRQMLQSWVGLPNILCQDFVVPELLQQNASAMALSRAVIQWFEAPEKVANLQVQFKSMHHLLQRNTAQLATNAIEDVLAS